MKPYAIVYSSRTGNTERLARRLRQALPQAVCVYYGPPGDTVPEAELIFAGFWTDKGDCDAAAAQFLERLRGRQVFLFGTAGFGGSGAYFNGILARVRGHLADGNQVAGSYLCQGEMPAAVRRRYEAMAQTEPEKAKPMLENFDRAVGHPNEADLTALEQAVFRQFPDASGGA